MMASPKAFTFTLLAALLCSMVTVVASFSWPTLYYTTTSASGYYKTMSGGSKLEQQYYREWLVSPKRGIAVKHLTCGQTVTTPQLGTVASPVCLVCGGPAAIADACVKNKDCVAFVIDQKLPACGYLKSAADTMYKSETETVYCYTPRAPGCTGRFSFGPNVGMRFTGDYKCYHESNGVEQPYCYISGSVSDVAKACLLDQDCMAFHYDATKPGGFLKNAAGTAKEQTGTDLYWRI